MLHYCRVPDPPIFRNVVAWRQVAIIYLHTLDSKPDYKIRNELRHVLALLENQKAAVLELEKCDANSSNNWGNPVHNEPYRRHQYRNIAECDPRGVAFFSAI
jgi:hypothetical protein